MSENQEDAAVQETTPPAEENGGQVEAESGAESEEVVVAAADPPMPEAAVENEAAAKELITETTLNNMAESLSTIENLQTRVDEMDLNESVSSVEPPAPATAADETTTSSSLSPSNCDLNTSTSPSVAETGGCESPESQSLSSSTINSISETTNGGGFQSLQPAQPAQQQSPSSTYSSRPSSIFNGRSLDPELSELLTRKQPKVVPSAPKCSKCDKSVYKAEEIRAAGKTFHKLCFKCTACNKLLEPNIITEHAGDLYCRNCYGKKFGPKGYGYGQGAGTLSTDSGSTSLVHISPTVVNQQKSGPTLKSTFSTLSTNQTESNSPPQPNFKPFSERRSSPGTATNFTFGGSDKCARCLKAVYAAEKVMASGKPYHKLCFACSTCKKLLNSMNCCNNSENEVFCKSCYGKQYGPKGIGYGVGAGTLQTN